MSLAKIFRTTAFRIAAVFAVLFLIASATLYTISYVLVSRELNKTLIDRIKEEAQTFIALDRSKGFASVIENIEASVSTQRKDDALFLLMNNKGDFVAGNIEPVKPFTDWRRFSARELSYASGKKLEDNPVVARMFTLSKGQLLVGHSTAEIVEVQEILTRSFAIGIAGSFLLSTCFAFWFGRRTQVRINSIGEALTTVSEGSIGGRIALNGSGDDLDQVSARVNDTLDQLQQLFDSIRHLSVDIAHDLKTPIGRIQLKLDDALRFAHGTEALRNVLIGTAEELDGVIETFDALLRIAQLEAGARKASFRSVELREVLNNIAEIYSSVADDADMHLECNLQNIEAASVHGDNELLTQMVVNLVENSIRHCPPGSNITLSLERNSSGPIIVVSDTGPGVPEGERSKVIQRLYRLEKSRTTPGSGLGLSLVAAIADLHGAKMELGDNDPGLVVRLSFPVLHAS